MNHNQHHLNYYNMQQEKIAMKKRDVYFIISDLFSFFGANSRCGEQFKLGKQCKNSYALCTSTASPSHFQPPGWLSSAEIMDRRYQVWFHHYPTFSKGQVSMPEWKPINIQFRKCLRCLNSI